MGGDFAGVEDILEALQRNLQIWNLFSGIFETSSACPLSPMNHICELGTLSCMAGGQKSVLKVSHLLDGPASIATPQQWPFPVGMTSLEVFSSCGSSETFT